MLKEYHQLQTRHLTLEPAKKTKVNIVFLECDLFFCPDESCNVATLRAVSPGVVSLEQISLWHVLAF